MLEKYKLTQSVRIHVYETASDLPSGLESFFSGLLKVLPWILLVVGAIGLCVVLFFVYKRIITKYRHTDKFWDKFLTVNAVFFLAITGMIYANYGSVKVYFAQKDLEVTIIKDQALTSSVDNPLYVKAGWVNGHDVELAVERPIQRVVPSGTAYAASDTRNGGIKMSFKLPDGKLLEKAPASLAFVSATPTAQMAPDRYQVILAAAPSTEPGEYSVDIDWQTSRRDSMMSVSTAQRLMDKSHDNKEVTDIYKTQDGEENQTKYYNSIGQYTDKDDIPTEEMYRTDCTNEEVLTGYGYNTSSDATKQATKAAAENRCGASKYPKFHHWLNAPHPIYRENIKNITFLDHLPGTIDPIDPKKKPEDKLNAGQRYCWDISERQTGQVVACAQRLPDISVKLDDIAGLGWGNSLGDVANKFTDAMNKVGCAAQWLVSWLGVEQCTEGKWNAETGVLFTLPQTLYKIEIGQSGGVNAPVNSSRLFFYVGQNTDFFLDGRFMVPRNNSRAWYDTVDLTKIEPVEAASSIPILGFVPKTQSYLANFVVDVGENVIIQTKVCAYSKYFAFGPRDSNNDCASGEARTEINMDKLIVKNVEDMTSMFEGSKFNDLSNSLPESFRTNTGNVRTMSRMFAYNNDMASWSGKGFNTSSVENFSGVFSGARFGMCDYKGGGSERCAYDDSEVYDGGGCGIEHCAIDVSNFDTSKATNMNNMFSDAREARNINVAGINTKNVTDMSFMFMATKNTSLDLSSFDTANVTNMAGMFSGTKLSSLDVSKFDTKNVTDMKRMFENLYHDSEGGGQLNLASFDTSKVADMSAMFSGSNIAALNLSTFNTSKVTNMKDMFFALGKSTQSVDVSKFDTSNVTDMSWMFANVTPVPADATCDMAKNPAASSQVKKTALILVPVSNAVVADQTRDLQKKLGAFVESLFSLDKEDECIPNDDKADDKIKKILISNYSKVIQEQTENRFGFSQAKLDLTSFNTSKVTKMEGMFAGSKADVVNFTPSTEPGIGFDTSKVTDMSWMFAGIGYSAITNFPLNTDSAQKMVGMFAGVSIYEAGGKLDISSFEVPEGNTPDVSWMFTSACVNKKIKGIVLSKSLQDYIDSLPDDNEDQNNKKKFIYEDITEGCGGSGDVTGDSSSGDGDVPAAVGAYVSPIPASVQGKVQMTARYGAYPSGGPHYGVDLAYGGDAAWEFVSVCDGVVDSVNINSKYPNSNSGKGGTTNYVWIKCDDGVFMGYAHFYKDTLKPYITRGYRIAAGTPIAPQGCQGNSRGTTVGREGKSCGPHLHFQVGKSGSTRDPVPYLQQKGISLPKPSY